MEEAALDLGRVVVHVVTEADGEILVADPKQVVDAAGVEIGLEDSRLLVAAEIAGRREPGEVAGDGGGEVAVHREIRGDDANRRAGAPALADRRHAAADRDADTACRGKAKVRVQAWTGKVSRERGRARRARGKQRGRQSHGGET